MRWRFHIPPISFHCVAVTLVPPPSWTISAFKYGRQAIEVVKFDFNGGLNSLVRLLPCRVSGVGLSYELHGAQCECLRPGWRDAPDARLLVEPTCARRVKRIPPDRRLPPSLAAVVSTQVVFRKRESTSCPIE